MLRARAKPTRRRLSSSTDLRSHLLEMPFRFSASFLLCVRCVMGKHHILTSTHHQPATHWSLIESRPLIKQRCSIPQGGPFSSSIDSPFARIDLTQNGPCGWCRAEYQCIHSLAPPRTDHHPPVPRNPVVSASTQTGRKPPKAKAKRPRPPAASKPPRCLPGPAQPPGSPRPTTTQQLTNRPTQTLQWAAAAARTAGAAGPSPWPCPSPSHPQQPPAGRGPRTTTAP